MAKTYAVKVKAPNRPDFPGYWSAQTFFPGGEEKTVSVDAKQLKQLLDDDAAGFLMLEGTEALRAQLAADPDAQAPAPAATASASLASDEQAALDEFRRQKAAASKAAPEVKTVPEVKVVKK